jgi:hypothetical protein
MANDDPKPDTDAIAADVRAALDGDEGALRRLYDLAGPEGLRELGEIARGERAPGSGLVELFERLGKVGEHLPRRGPAR